MTEGVLPKPSCIWVKPPHGCLLLACSIPSCVYVFSVYVQFLAILKHKAQGEYQSVQAEMCAEWVQAGFEAYRPCEVVHLRRICPSFSLVCPTLPPSSAHCAAVAWDGLQTRVEWEVWDPSHENAMVSELDARNHTGRFGVWFPKVHNIFFVWSSEYVQWT